MNNKTAGAAIIITAVLTAGLTAVIQPKIPLTTDTKTEQSTSTSTVTSTVTSTETRLVTSTVTSTATVTSTETSTTTETSTATTTATTTTTTTVTITTQPDAPQTLSIDLISVQRGRAASWSKTQLTVLINMSGTAASNPDLQTIDAVGGAINQWRTSIAQFAEDHTEYVHLDSLTLTVYVQGFNDTLLRGRPDVRISFTDTLPSLLAETNLYITNTPQITSANTTAAVQGLSKQGLQNVLVHEIGHVFGISHTEFENDTMYGEREKQVVSTERLCPSTLDLYALASLYQWIQTGVYRPYAGTSVTLPQNITYQTVAYG